MGVNLGVGTLGKQDGKSRPYVRLCLSDDSLALATRYWADSRITVTRLPDPEPGRSRYALWPDANEEPGTVRMVRDTKPRKSSVGRPYGHLSFHGLRSPARLLRGLNPIRSEGARNLEHWWDPDTGRLTVEVTYPKEKARAPGREPPKEPKEPKGGALVGRESTFTATAPKRPAPTLELGEPLLVDLPLTRLSALKTSINYCIQEMAAQGNRARVTQAEPGAPITITVEV